jgi:hypothetical protein
LHTKTITSVIQAEIYTASETGTLSALLFLSAVTERLDTNVFEQTYRAEAESATFPVEPAAIAAQVRAAMAARCLKTSPLVQ